MRKLTVNVGKGYDIMIEKDSIKDCGKLVRNITTAKNALIISDSNVSALYAPLVEASLKTEGFVTSIFSFPAGETSKTLTTVSDMLTAASNAGLSRGDIIIALGGGITGDLAGFCASIYLRGIAFVQIPTSLLAMVDSSVGGKTGCDLPAGKNLVGSFWQPNLVLIDTAVLETLPKRYFNDGLAEVIKTACIKSASLFEQLEKNSPEDILEEMIFECVDNKRKVVEIDEKETGDRKLLNFGHTLAHAIEKYYHFEGYSHGEAVAIGMAAITTASEKAGFTKAGTSEKLLKMLKRFQLPTTCEVDFEKLVPLCFNDKKRVNDKINIVLLKDIGESFIMEIEINKLLPFIMDGAI